MTTSITSAPVLDVKSAHVSPQLPVDQHVTGVHTGVACDVMDVREAELAVVLDAVSPPEGDMLTLAQFMKCSYRCHKHRSPSCYRGDMCNQQLMIILV